jgi:hypothetical protein
MASSVGLAKSIDNSDIFNVKLAEAMEFAL